MMILKVINNNVISAYDEKGKEIVVMGKGIGFQKKPGDKMDKKLIEKKFSLPDENTSQFEELLKDIPYEHIHTASKIVSYIKSQLSKPLNKNIYITLTDHLNFAVERARLNINIENALLWEIKRFYPEEFKLGLWALRTIKEELNVLLSEDEAGFFALHIVNAEMGGDMRQTMRMPEIIKDIMNIIRYTFGISPDETSLYYERLLTHIKFFLKRMVREPEYKHNKDDDEFNYVMRESFPEEYRCARRINDYIKARLQYEMPDEELTYLTAHIHRIISKD